MSVKNSTKSRRKHDASFKEDVLKMIASGRPVSEVAQAFVISASQIQRWNRKSKSALSSSATPVGSLVPLQGNLAIELERLSVSTIFKN